MQRIDRAIAIRCLALLTTFFVLGFLVSRLLDLGVSEYALFFLMLAGVMGLLIRVSSLPVNKIVWSRRQLIGIRVHVYLHLVPFSYLALQAEISPSLDIHLLYYVPVVAFFYTGRRTWLAFFDTFGSKVYKLFYLGNTGMIVTLSVLLGLGLIFKEATLVTSFQKLFMLYFSVHLLIVGAVVIKIENDISGYRVVE